MTPARKPHGGKAGQRHGPRATARRNDTDTSDTSKDGQRHGHRDRRRRTQGTQGPAPHTSGDGPQAAAEHYQLTRQAHKASGRRHGAPLARPKNGPPRATKGPRRASGPADGRKAASGHENGHHGHGRTPATDRPPARRTDASGKDRQPVHQPHGRTPPRRTATASASTGGHQYGKPHRHRHGRRPKRADHWRPVQTSFWGVRREPCLYSSACKWKCDQHTSKSCRGRRGHRRRGRAEVARREFF